MKAICKKMVKPTELNRLDTCEWKLWWTNGTFCGTQVEVLFYRGQTKCSLEHLHDFGSAYSKTHTIGRLYALKICGYWGSFVLLVKRRCGQIRWCARTVFLRCTQLFSLLKGGSSNPIDASPSINRKNLAINIPFWNSSLIVEEPYTGNEGLCGKWHKGIGRGGEEGRRGERREEKREDGWARKLERQVGFFSRALRFLCRSGKCVEVSVSMLQARRGYVFLCMAGRFLTIRTISRFIHTKLLIHVMFASSLLYFSLSLFSFGISPASFSLWITAYKWQMIQSLVHQSHVL